MAASAGLLLLRAWRIDFPYSIDFRVYHVAAERLASGQAGSLYAPARVNDGGQELDLPANEFKNLPIVAVLFRPLAPLPYLQAKRVFWFASLGCLVAAALVTALALGEPGRRPDPVFAGLLVALFLAAAPAHISLRHGQLTPLATLFLSVFAAAAVRGRDRIAGAALAAATALKLPLLALAARDLLRGPRRRAAVWAGATGLLLIVSLLAFGPALHASYLAHLSEHAGAAITGHNNQSLAGVMMRALFPGGLQDWTPRPEPDVVRALRWGASLLLVGLLVAAMLRVRPASAGPAVFALEMTAFLSLGLLISPVAWDHYFLVLVLALPYLLWGARRGAGLGGWAFRGGSLLAGLLLLLPTPPPLIAATTASGPIAQVLIAHYALGAIVLFVLSTVALFNCRQGELTA